MHRRHLQPRVPDTAAPCRRESTGSFDCVTPIQHEAIRLEVSLDERIPAHAIQTEVTGKLRVAYDIRHLTLTQVGTRTYAVCLANALAEIPEIDMTLLVLHESQAGGLKGRVVTEEQWTDDVAVIHKPSQVGNQTELSLLFQSSAHVIITYQDLIAYRIPSAFSSDAEFNSYRATSRLSVMGAQRIIAYSENAHREISKEFGTPGDEITVTPLGVDADWFAGRGAGDRAILNEMKMPAPIFSVSRPIIRIRISPNF